MPDTNDQNDSLTPEEQDLVIGAIPLQALPDDHDEREFPRLRREFASNALGDRPHGMSAAKLKRLIQLERLDAVAKSSPAPVVDKHAHRWVGRGEYGGTAAGYMCADCGIDADDVDEPAAASPAAPQEDAPIRREIRSSRHPHFTYEDHQRMKEALDSLSDYPTEEEAEAVLQACGSSGKEVVNEFIERLLRENMELKAKLDAATPTPSQPARDAAKEIADWLNWRKNIPEAGHEQNITSIAGILSRYLPAEIVRQTGGFTCDCCGRNMEVRVDGKFCNECAGYRSTANALPAAAAETVGEANLYEQAVTVGWEATNARRHELISKKTAGLTSDEANELRELQWLAGIKRELQNGPPLVTADSTST